MVANRWNNDEAAKAQNALDELVYRSNLLGSDRAVANWGGGNTSIKDTAKDFRGREIEVMWVKGSGSDLATMQARHFTGLNLEDIKPLLERDEMSDEEMVAYLGHCILDSKHPRPSIETLLHAFLPFKHVDHTHPDAIISLCCTEGGRAIAEQIYGDRFAWVPYIRPGFTLSKMIAEAVRANPQAELVLMEKHGLVTWGETSEESYQHTINIINEAQQYIEAQAASKAQPLFGGQKYSSLSAEERQQVLVQILPVVRGEVSREQRMLVTNDASADVLTFVNSVNAAHLSQVGAACPDHLVHTKRVPLFIDWEPNVGQVEVLIERIKAGIARYKQEYQAYFEENKVEGDQITTPSPRVILIPGLGMLNTGKSWSNAKISEALYHRAISVMKGTDALGIFTSLNASESYAIEYWPLELYKLSLQPPEAEFSRQVALITGGAGGIGSATARRLLKEGAHVVLADINLEGAQKVAQELNQEFGEGRALASRVDVTNEEAVYASFADSLLTYGGVDILVNNAGIAAASPFDETTLKDWNFNISILATGYFLVAREAFKIMKRQGTGGSMVFITSKNAIYAGKNAAAYSTAKAAEAHLARCIAAEGGDFGIRVNSVLPDAVLQGSTIWGSRWRNERAEAYGIRPDQLEEYYRKRTVLQVNIYPEDIANAVAYFSSRKAEKTTGCQLTVDGGVAAAFTR
ncbi:bifunctional aldolase/short-chain dehydrogenase [Tengunoibacter tsumagoiensis]|uniref:Putative oxidoreductase YuxG n=1 Tax=Tengunoibacter tsumagoiensis TaxID=2014871 RepID=A0A402A3Q0_9CHLR|nr:bifunctional aldolase/short-chain dehydrogenase [Tengunoibacter tsumagoiensis]GCE13777.1 putative oxidoreductase YuxG [Tengunoibacter tsumagoiensis]